jgi:transcriptional regulator of arginine metabolism
MRIARKEKIYELISLNEIETQQQLADLLNSSGFSVTQATVSRDIRELRLEKKVNSRGKNVYCVPAQSPAKSEYMSIMMQTVLSAEPADNIIVVKTKSGCANAVAEAIDDLSRSEIVGTLAGDNTILVVVKSKDFVPEILADLRSFIPAQA